MLISALVPTWQRSDDLARCLAGLASQDRPADEVVVVVRKEDAATAAVLAGWEDAVRVVNVEEPGLVQALNRGLEAASGDVIAITDDDAVPRPDWLARIEEHFDSDPSVGGVGGRDWVRGPDGCDEGRRAQVGRLQWFGRVIGNHHLGFGPAREVDLLKGVNMSYRAASVRGLRFDSRLRGRHHFNDAAFSLALRHRGWRLVYDPEVAVDHYPAPTQGDPRTGSLSAAALTDSAHNETLALLELMPDWRRFAFLLWAVFVGTSAAPGLLQAVRLAVRSGSLAGIRSTLSNLIASMNGRSAGWRTWREDGRAETSGSPERPEITLVANNVGGIGGMEEQLARLIGGLLDAGHTVTLISWTCAIADHPRLRWVRLRGPRRPFAIGYPWFLLRGGWLTKRHGRGLIHVTGAIYAGRSDLTTVHFCHRSFRRQGVSRAKRRSVPYVLNSRVSELLSLLGEAWCYRPERTGRLVAVSGGLAAELRAEYPSMRDRIETIPNGVDAERFKPDREAGAAVRSGLRISEQERVACFVGSEWGRKGLSIALAGVARAEGWHLLVVGAGDAAQYALEAQGLGVAGRVHFVGAQTDVVPFYSASSAFLLPTAYETFSLVAYEAAAVGLPILATRVSGIEDIVEPGVTGWFVERNAESVGRHLQQLAEDPERAAEIGAAARQRAASFGWDRIVVAYRDLYRSLEAG